LGCGASRCLDAAAVGLLSKSGENRNRTRARGSVGGYRRERNGPASRLDDREVPMSWPVILSSVVCVPDCAQRVFSQWPLFAHSGHRIGSRRELFTALLFARLYGRRIKLYRGIHLRRAVPSFTVELRRRPRLATNSSQNPRLSETKILQAPFERGSHSVAAAAFEANTSTSPANVAPAQPTGRILQCLVPDETPRGQPREVLLTSPSSDLTSEACGGAVRL
jgi:hypothetical protein